MEALESPRLFRRKTLNSTEGKRATSLATKKQSCKRGAVGACGAGGIKIILALLGGLRVWDGWLQLGEQILAELCHHSSVYSAEAGMRTGTHASLGVRFFIVPKSIWITLPGGVFSREQEPIAIAARLDIV